MADEIKISYTSGYTLYAVVSHDYTGTQTTISLTDDTGDEYTGDFDNSIAQGMYTVEIYLQVGGSVDMSVDHKLGTGIVVWDGVSRCGLENFVMRMKIGSMMTWTDLKTGSRAA
jgi:hypothetical protein